jgi:hypothetical protein
MDWISVKDRLPDKFKEVIVATEGGRVKSAIYAGDDKWNTFLNITHWMEYPEAPEVDVVVDVEEPVNKRGRKKKV